MGSLSGKGKLKSYSQEAKSDIAGRMKVTFKTLDQRSFDLEVGSDEGVEELICKGKMMHEGEMVSDYKMTGKLPVVGMVTKLENFRRQEREAEEGPKAKRVRTESEDSGFGDDEGDHFVTDREFSIALEVVMTCQHFRRPSELVSVEDMEQMEEVAPTREQFKAFALDIQSMYQEGRVLPPMVESDRREDMHNSQMEEDDEDEEEEVGLVERNLRTMIGMGFAKEDAEEALNRSSGSLQVALDLLLPRGPATPPPLPSTPNPLAFLRDIPEFQYLRVVVMQQPDLLQPLLLSFGQTHPEVMRTIHENRETFVAMLYEQTGGATSRYARHH